MPDLVERVDCFVLTLPRDEPYLGALRPGEAVNAQGYVVRKGNRTVYPTFDRSVLVRLTTADGATGWGETYGIVAPGAVKAIVEDLLTSFVIGRDPFDAAAVHDDLYDLMRVRGYTGGFYLDALAAIDIALWDLAGKLASLPIRKLLGGQRRSKVPAYVSGLPKPTLEERVAFAQSWIEQGYGAVKFAAVVADDGNAAELQALREGLGEQVAIAIDLHWKYTAADAISVINELQAYRPWFCEAPVQPEDLEGQVDVAGKVTVPIALGEEWRTVFDARTRFERRAAAIVQPEMGRTVITEFMRIATLAQAHHLQVIPHASIGVGIFLAASLQASSAVHDLPAHEFQHSIFAKNLRVLAGGRSCAEGFYSLPDGPGLGVEPNADALRLLEN
ncbi:MAG: mandelate racemase/muconate lactonizing enzyme family protein [Pseudomonadota bacterium]